MRIGINALFQANGGSLTNLRHLLKEWRVQGAFDMHEFYVFASRHTQERVREELPSNVKVEVFSWADHSFLARLLTEQTALSRSIGRKDLDVLYCPANTLPFSCSVPVVLTLQNAAPFTPSVSQQAIPWQVRLRWIGLRHLIRWGAARAARVIFGSQHFRDRFLVSMPLDQCKLRVIYRACQGQAAEEQMVRSVLARYGIRRPYALMVSHLYPTKNIEQLLEGFHAAKRRGCIGNVQLVLAGGTSVFPEYFTSIQKLVQQLGLRPEEVVFTGSVPHHEVGALLTGCDMFVFTSTCENSPHSLLEALAMGKPIACSNVDVMPEIAGNAAFYFDPYDPADISHSLEEVLSNADLRTRLSQRALSRAREFPGHAEVARQTLDAITSIAASKPRRQAA